jgi:hypothetical protein
MSGLLRRIKRSRPADAGEPLQEGRAAETEGATHTAETPPAAAAETAGKTPSGPPEHGGAPGATSGDATVSTSGDPTGTASGDATAPTSGDATGTATNDPSATTKSELPAVTPSKRARRRPFGRRSKRPSMSTLPAPVLLADPNMPAGVDPAEQPIRPPKGRRGRLRRRLRYLRRARELMLRDLGGLLYEVHRTGGGNVDAHATIVGTKVQRIAGLDAEAHAIETALAAPRAETVVFEPGVGGTCAVCGELYGSDARFCSNCGTPIGAAAEPKAPAAEPKLVAEPTRRAFWRRAARPAAGSDEAAVQPPDEAAGQQAAAARDETAVQPRDETATDEAAGQEPAAAAGGDEPAEQPGNEATVDETAVHGAGGDETAVDETPLQGAGGDETAADETAVQGAGGGGDETAVDETPLQGAGGDETAADETAVQGAGAGGDETAAQPRDERATDETAVQQDDEAAGKADQTAGEGPAAREDGPRADAATPPAEEPGNPYSRLRNGRPDETQKPPGSPLVSRERS